MIVGRLVAIIHVPVARRSSRIVSRKSITEDLFSIRTPPRRQNIYFICALFGCLIALKSLQYDFHFGFGWPETEEEYARCSTST
jgi:hypothetical protein